MAQMAAAAAADHLGAAQEQALVRPQLNSLGDGRLVEARPARAGRELGVRAEQFVPAPGAAVGAALLVVDVLTGEGHLRVAAAQHVVLLAGKFMPPLLVRLLDLGRCGGLSCLGAAHRYSPDCGVQSGSGPLAETSRPHLVIPAV